jgi:hypothetical protein
MLRALKIAGFLLLVDSLIAVMPFSTIIDLSPNGVMGDLMLGEVAVLFIIAGILDFSSSIGMAQVRKTFLSSKEDYSPEIRKEKERTAMVFLFTGLVLLVAMILLMVYNLSVYRTS